MNIRRDPEWAVIYLCLAITLYFLFPQFTKWRYARNMLVSVREQSSKMINIPVYMDMSEETILIKIGSTESRTPTSDIAKIIELPTIVIIEFSSSLIRILPKHQNRETDVVISRLKEVASHLGAKYRDQTGWKWK